MGVAHQWRTLPQRTYSRPIQKRIPARHEGNLQAQQAFGTIRLVEQHLQSAHIQLHNIQSAYLLRESTLAPRPRVANLNIPQKMNRLITSIIVCLVAIAAMAQKAQIKVGYEYHFSTLGTLRKGRISYFLPGRIAQSFTIATHNGLTQHAAPKMVTNGIFSKDWL